MPIVTKNEPPTHRPVGVLAIAATKPPVISLAPIGVHATPSESCEVADRRRACIVEGARNDRSATDDCDVVHRAVEHVADRLPGGAGPTVELAARVARGGEVSGDCPQGSGLVERDTVDGAVDIDAGTQHLIVGAIPRDDVGDSLAGGIGEHPRHVDRPIRRDRDVLDGAAEAERAGHRELLPLADRRIGESRPGVTSREACYRRRRPGKHMTVPIALSYGISHSIMHAWCRGTDRDERDARRP